MNDTMVWTVIIVAACAWAFWKFVWPKGDVNGDGKLDINDAKAFTDVNRDGKVGVSDIKAASEIVAEKVTTKVQEEVAKVTQSVATKAQKNVTKRKTSSAGKSKKS